MRTNILADFNEPTDNELVELMQEVAREVKISFVGIKQQQQDKINKEISLAAARYNAKQK